MAKDVSFHSDKRKKLIYKDKVDLSIKIIQKCDRNQNLMPKKGHTHYKVIKNLIRTVGSIKFEVKPKNYKDDDGFIFKFIYIPVGCHQ